MLRITSAVASFFALSVLAGCGGGGSSSGTPPTSAQLTISPSATLTFPSTTIGQTSAAQTLTLTNSGTATLTLSAGSLSGSGAADFTATTNCGTSLAASASCTFTIAFAPQTSGTLTATITLTDNASNSPQTITFTGGGTAVPAATLTPAAGLTFPSTTIGQTTPSQGLTLTNTGTATLSIASIALGGTNPTDFTETNTCPATLAAGSSCPISVTFSPAAVASYTATLTVTDNSGNTTGSTQSVPLTGNGTAVPSPQATLTPTTGLTFPSTSVGNLATPQTVTLTNIGNAALSIAGIAVGGANPTGFAQTNTCPAMLPAGSSCPIPVAFAPAAVISYAATLTVTDNSGNVAGATQSVTLSGMGTAATTAITRTLDVFPETDKSITPLYSLVNNALKSIDMTMYELEDTVFTGDLVAACNRGVTVRVLLDGGPNTKNNNTSAYTQLNTSAANCSAEFSNTAFQATHQKTITVDGTTTAIMTLNLQSQYYSTAHDFALVENDPADITAIEDTFNKDYAAGTPYGGTQGTSDFADQPGSGTGDELIWSPTTAEAAMLSIINSATKTLLIENEEMSSSNIVNDLETACSKNGVTVHIAMSENSTTPPFSPYSSNWIALEEAGCGVHVYPDTTTGPYIHANAVVADYGLPTENAYMGSIKYSDNPVNSDASMTENRELGIFITDPAAVTLLNTTMSADYAGGIVFTGGTVD